jgi:cobalamin biosynthesis protein CobT
MLEDSYYRANLSDVREQEEDTLVEGTVMVLISEELTSAAASKSSERLVGT